MAKYETAGTIVSDAAVLCGLGAQTDAYASLDPNIQQMVVLLERLGRRLTKEYQWAHLVSEHTFPTEDGTALYDLPEDFVDMVDQTGWNRDSRQPAVPLSPQQWQFLKASVVAGQLTVMFRPRLLQLEILPTPTAVETIAFEYRTRFWVSTGEALVPSADEPAASEHILLFDPEMLISGLRLEWKKAKGFDTTSAQQDYDADLKLAESASVVAAPVLSLNGRGPGPRLINGCNVPETGYGQ